MISNSKGFPSTYFELIFDGLNISNILAINPNFKSGDTIHCGYVFENGVPPGTVKSNQILINSILETIVYDEDLFRCIAV